MKIVHLTARNQKIQRKNENEKGEMREFLRGQKIEYETPPRNYDTNTPENKKLAFEFAEFGTALMSIILNVYGTLCTHKNILDVQEI